MTRRWRLPDQKASRASVLILVAAVLTAFGLFTLTELINSRDNHRLIQLQATDATVSITSEMSQIEATMSSVGSVASVTDGSRSALQKLTRGEQGMSTFSSVAVLREAAERPTVVIPVKGRPRITPDLTGLPSSSRAGLARAAAGGDLQVLGFLGQGAGRLLMVAMGTPGGPGGYVVYGEVPLPAGATVPSPFPKLDYAVYAGTSDTGPILFSSTKQLPLRGDRVDELIDMNTAAVSTTPEPGGSYLLFVVTAKGTLLSEPALLLPWLLGGLAVLIGILVVLAIRSAARRRDVAIGVANDLKRKNLELDEAMANSLEAERARQQLEAELQQAQRLEAVGQLAGGIAHDFNNLLMVIQTHVDFLATEVPADEVVQSDLAEVRAAAQRAADLTKRLLVFSRRDLVRPSVLDVNGAVADVLGLLRRTVGEDVRLSLKADETVPRVLCDSGELHQVLVNLVVNARQAITGNGSITISTSVADLDEEAVLSHPDVKPGRYVRIAVADTGCGMTQETAARVFEPYFTTKEPGSGTGLGLSTVYGIVRRYGGYCTVESTLGIGSVISVHLPATDRREDHVGVEAPAEPAVTDARRVLVVEDEDGVRRACRRILEGAGFEVIEASSGGEALSRYRDTDFDLLVTDVVMPGRISGRELVETLQARRPGLPVLYMSGYSRDAIARRGVLEEGIAVIEKPFTPAELLANVVAVLAPSGLDPVAG